MGPAIHLENCDINLSFFPCTESPPRQRYLHGSVRQSPDMPEAKCFITRNRVRLFDSS